LTGKALLRLVNRPIRASTPGFSAKKWMVSMLRVTFVVRFEKVMPGLIAYSVVAGSRLKGMTRPVELSLAVPPKTAPSTTLELVETNVRPDVISQLTLVWVPPDSGVKVVVQVPVAPSDDEVAISRTGVRFDNLIAYVQQAAPPPPAWAMNFP